MVLPSPAGVGLIAVTNISLPSGFDSSELRSHNGWEARMNHITRRNTDVVFVDLNNGYGVYGYTINEHHSLQIQVNVYIPVG